MLSTGQRIYQISVKKIGYRHPLLIRFAISLDGDKRYKEDVSLWLENLREEVRLTHWSSSIKFLRYSQNIGDAYQLKDFFEMTLADFLKLEPHAKARHW